VRSLDGEDNALYPYLPYLLQDLWEIGSSADVVLDLIRRQNLHQRPDTHVLDLGCGKGAVSIPMAREFGFRIHGIDAMPAFIREASDRSKKSQVAHLCRFETGDIRRVTADLRDYQLVILGSIGPVLGNVEQSLRQVRTCLVPEGHVILDDGYVRDNSPLRSQDVLSESELKNQIQHSGFVMLDRTVMDRSLICESNQQIYRFIEKRAAELIGKHPEKRELFKDYLRAQQRENSVLEDEMVCVAWLLKRL